MSDAPLIGWLDALDAEAAGADAREAECRAEFERRVRALAEARAFAHRRANLMRAVAGAAARAEDADGAVAYGLAALRARLGWSSESEARTEILDRFAPVARAAWAVRDGGDDVPAEDSPGEALAAFEAWYGEVRGAAFWTLFENPMPETPLVDW